MCEHGWIAEKQSNYVGIYHLCLECNTILGFNLKMSKNQKAGNDSDFDTK